MTEQLNVTVNEVKFTFYQYPFKISATENFEDILRMPNLLDLAAMKAYARPDDPVGRALGRRSKWKDYVDMYFILKNHFSVNQIAERTTLLYGQLFSEKLFRAQLSYFDDIDFAEQVEFTGSSIAESEIKKFLIDKAIDLF